MPLELTPNNPAASPEGYYTSMAKMNPMIGASNVVLWSTLEQTDAAGQANTTIVVDVLRRTDNYINRRLRESGYTSPLPIGSKDFAYLSDLATEYACWMLYMGKPETLVDVGEDIAGRMANHRDHSESELSRLLEFGLDAAKLIVETSGISVVRACPDPCRFVRI